MSLFSLNSDHEGEEKVLENHFEFTCKMCYVNRNCKIIAAGRKQEAEIYKQAAKAKSQANRGKKQRNNAW
jgi:hypothetical protein